MNDPRSMADLFKNVAGRVNSDPMKAILFTLQKSFGQCRVLHDLPDDQPDLVNKFINLVCLTVPTSDRDSELQYAGVLLFSFYKASVFPLAD
jgi:hypothetical protein